MIEYIRGELTELTPAMAVVEAAGVGYALNISLNTYTCIQGKKDVKLYVHEALVTGGRDDSFTLFGFATKQERDLYRLLISVSGVGGNTARMMLSSLSPAELCNAIANADERLIKSIKGIGLKTAQRIIVDLKDKIVAEGIADKMGDVIRISEDSARQSEEIKRLAESQTASAEAVKIKMDQIAEVVAQISRTSEKSADTARSHE